MKFTAFVIGLLISMTASATPASSKREEVRVTNELNQCFALRGEKPVSTISIPERVCVNRVHQLLNVNGSFLKEAMAVGTLTADGQVLDIPLRSERAWPTSSDDEVAYYSFVVSERKLCRAELSCGSGDVLEGFRVWMRFAPADADGRAAAGSWRIDGVLTGENGRETRVSYELVR